MFKTALLAAICVVIGVSGISAQTKEEIDAKRTAGMKKLDVLVGSWKGSGWVMTQTMRAISQIQRVGLLAGSVLLAAAALTWIAFGAAPVRAAGVVPTPSVVQDKSTEAMNLKLIMHRLGTTEPRRP